jgi:hypothetical protein
VIRIFSEATISSTLPLSKEGILHVFNPRFPLLWTSSLLWVLHHWSLVFKYQHCYLFFKHHHSSRSSSVFTAYMSSSVFTAYRSSSVFTAYRSSSVTTASAILYWPLTDISIESIRHKKFPLTFLLDRRKSS